MIINEQGRGHVGGFMFLMIFQAPTMLQQGCGYEDCKTGRRGLFQLEYNGGLSGAEKPCTRANSSAATSRRPRTNLIPIFLK
jgi:hypothetical protein